MRSSCLKSAGFLPMCLILFLLFIFLISLTAIFFILKSLNKNILYFSSPTEIKQKDNGISKLVLISDGQFGENQLENNKPLELGYDKWTNNFYSNKKFLMNIVHYLIDKNFINQIGLKKVKSFTLQLMFI